MREENSDDNRFFDEDGAGTPFPKGSLFWAVVAVLMAVVSGGSLC